MNDGTILLIIGILTGFAWGVTITGLVMFGAARIAARWTYEEGKKEGKERWERY